MEVPRNPWEGCCRDDSLTPEHDDYSDVGADEMCRDCPYVPTPTTPSTRKEA